MKKYVILLLMQVFLLHATSIYANLITDIRHGGPEAVIQKLVTSSGNFSMDNAVCFFVQLKNEINELYQINIDFNDAMQEIVKSNLIDGLSQKEIDTFVKFYFNISESLKDLETDESMLFNQKQKSNFIYRKKNTEHRQCNDPELFLPDKMAVGFVCILAGGLLCVIPGSQVYGVELMMIGGTFVLDGMVGGEKPYYVDPITGQRVDAPNLNED